MSQTDNRKTNKDRTPNKAMESRFLPDFLITALDLRGIILNPAKSPTKTKKLS
jgi:hypothetical protein